MGLRELRESKCETRRSLAALLGVTEQTIINIENRGYTSRENLFMLADHYGVSTDEILGRETPNPTAPVEYSTGHSLSLDKEPRSLTNTQEA